MKFLFPQAERDKTKGKDWYNLPATEVTEEIKNDLEVLRMRSALNPKHVYKKNDMKVIPKYFQVCNMLIPCLFIILVLFIFYY